jgi:beta-lactamase regulating signal transducer with metallopeptidase domain
LLAGKPLFRNTVSKAFSYYIWLLVLLRLSLPIPSPIHFTAPPLGFEPPVMSALPDEKAVFPETDQAVRQPAGEIHTQPPPSPEGPNTPAVRTQAPATGQRSSGLWVLLQRNLPWIWLGGAIASIGWFSASYAVFSRRIRRSCAEMTEDDAAVFERLRNGRRIPASLQQPCFHADVPRRSSASHRPAPDGLCPKRHGSGAADDFAA